MISRTNKKLITLSDRNLDMMDEIAIKTGWTTPTEIIKRGLEELHSKCYPAYKYSNSMGNSEEVAIKTAQIKQKAKEVTEQATKEAKLSNKTALCKELFNGEVKEENGSMVCVYTQYTLRGDNELSIPISQVDPIVAQNTQFLPSKETIFKNRPEVKKLYEKIEAK